MYKRQVQSCPAIAALGVSVHVAGDEIRLNFCVRHACPDIAEAEFFVADELVAGVEVAPRSDGHVLCAGAAARNALVNARAAGEINHVVVERERFAGAAALQHEDVYKRQEQTASV